MDTPCVQYEIDGREYPPEAVWQAQEMFCVLRMPYDQVAEATGIAASTLKRWGQQYGWMGKRSEMAQAQAEIRADTVLARSAMLKELLDTRQPLVGFAVAKLEELALKQAAAEREGRIAEAQAAAAPPRLEINTPADAAVALKQAVEAKLARLLARPEDVDLKAVQNIKQALDIIGDLEGGKDKDREGKGLSAEDVDMIRTKILGG